MIAVGAVGLHLLDRLLLGWLRAALSSFAFLPGTRSAAARRDAESGLQSVHDAAVCSGDRLRRLGLRQERPAQGFGGGQCPGCAGSHRPRLDDEQRTPPAQLGPGLRPAGYAEAIREILAAEVAPALALHPELEVSLEVPHGAAGRELVEAQPMPNCLWWARVAWAASPGSCSARCPTRSSSTPAVTS